MSNIRRPFYAVKAGAAILLLSIHLQAQPQLLGAADLSAPPTRTPAGFTVFGRGFIGRDNPKRVRKSINWLTNHDASHLADNFTLYASMVSDHWYLIAETDSAWRVIRERWIDCGGRYETVARSTSPRSISVYIEPGPFRHPQQEGLLNGMTDGSIIRASIISANSVSTDPHTAWLVTYRAIVEYEMGNLLGVRLGIPWTGYTSEIGDRSPCGN